MTSLVAATLLAALQQLAAGSGLTVAVDVELLERADAAPVGVQATRAMPMASTFKLPLAIAVLHAVDQGELGPLDAPVTLLPVDMHAHASPLYERMPRGGKVALREVLAQLLEASDNSAADALVRIAGGGAKVTAALRALGVDGLTIDRNEAEMGRDLERVGVAKFDADPRDHATPAAMVKLLGKLWRGELLGAASTAFVQEHMARCHTGLGRLRAGVPKTAAVADRTGTCGGEWCANAVGVITLPSGEHALVAAFVSGAGPTAAKEKLIADVARAVWATKAR